ncbi:MAG: hypothetical protein DRJ34_00375 [Thermoprotei archaeon]|nr:MAG: hypothetical protein DRJ34_00375 [Thermoprotei archaeon]
MWKIYEFELSEIKPTCFFKSLLFSLIQINQYEDYIFMIHPSLNIIDRAHREFKAYILYNNKYKILKDHYQILFFSSDKIRELKIKIDVKYTFSSERRKRRSIVEDSFFLFFYPERRFFEEDLLKIILKIRRIKGLGRTSIQDIYYILQTFLMKNIKRFCK